MSDLTYFRIGVPNDMVADIMWNDEFEVSMEPVILRAKPETNYQRYFGTPEKAAKWLNDKVLCEYCRFYSECTADIEECEDIMRKWLESEAE